MQFVRDTVKKLIYAMEQNEMTPSSSGAQRGMATSRDGTKKTGGEFNANGTQLLPNLGPNDTQKGINSSFIDFRNDKP